MADIKLGLVPFSSPNYVVVKQPTQRRHEGFTQSVTRELAEVEANTLAQMCDEFRAEVFRKAGKPDPASAF